MTKVRIRQALARTRWQLVTFCGVLGAESVGVVDLMAIRKDHGNRLPYTKRGDTFQIILIQVKGGKAPMPTAEDGHRLRAVARHHRPASTAGGVDLRESRTLLSLAAEASKRSWGLG
jgi:hypothetical protein